MKITKQIKTAILITTCLALFACDQKATDLLPPPVINLPVGKAPEGDANLNKAPKISFTYITDPKGLVSKIFGSDNADFVPVVPIGKTFNRFFVLAEDPDGDAIGEEIRIIDIQPPFEPGYLPFSAVDGLCKEDYCNFSLAPSDAIPLGQYKITLGISDAPSAEKQGATYAAKESQAVLNVEFGSLENLAPVLGIYNSTGGLLESNPTLSVRQGITTQIRINAKDPDRDPIDNQTTFDSVQGCQVQQKSVTCASPSECDFLFTIACQARVDPYPIGFTIYDKPTRHVDRNKTTTKVFVNVR